MIERATARRSNPPAEQRLEAEDAPRRRSASVDQARGEQRHGGIGLPTRKARLLAGAKPLNWSKPWTWSRDVISPRSQSAEKTVEGPRKPEDGT